jgi:hypothetical protein
MARKKTWTPQEEAEITRIQRATGVSRKSAIRKMRAATPKPKAKPQKTSKAKSSVKTGKKAAGNNRAEGIRLFKLAGRPTKQQFVLVYGQRGPKLTWDQRAAAGVPANKFQAALAEKSRG